MSQPPGSQGRAKWRAPFTNGRISGLCESRNRHIEPGHREARDKTIWPCTIDPPPTAIRTGTCHSWPAGWPTSRSTMLGSRLGLRGRASTATRPGAGTTGRRLACAVEKAGGSTIAADSRPHVAAPLAADQPRQLRPEIPTKDTTLQRLTGPFPCQSGSLPTSLSGDLEPGLLYIVPAAPAVTGMESDRGRSGRNCIQ